MDGLSLLPLPMARTATGAVCWESVAHQCSAGDRSCKDTVDFQPPSGSCIGVSPTGRGPCPALFETACTRATKSCSLPAIQFGHHLCDRGREKGLRLHYAAVALPPPLLISTCTTQCLRAEGHHTRRCGTLVDLLGSSAASSTPTALPFTTF